MKSRSFLKLVGLAGLAGVATTGVVVARAERQRRSYTPEQVLARLHDRLASLEGEPPEEEVDQTHMEGSHRFEFARRLNSWRGRPGGDRMKRA